MPYLINERYHKYAENILSLSFKGERTYLHGTDIFPSLLKITGPIKNLSIQFHKTTSKKLKLHFLKPSDVAEFRKCNDLCVLMIFTRLGNREVISITETKKKVSLRRPYDEERVTCDSKIEDKQIIQQNPISGNFAERVVALNKKLLNYEVKKQPWLFTQLDLEKAPVEPKELILKLERVIGSQVYQTLIHGDGNFLGKIRFSKNSK